MYKRAISCLVLLFSIVSANDNIKNDNIYLAKNMEIELIKGFGYVVNMPKNTTALDIDKLTSDTNIKAIAFGNIFTIDIKDSATVDKASLVLYFKENEKNYRSSLYIKIKGNRNCDKEKSTIICNTSGKTIKYNTNIILKIKERKKLDSLMVFYKAKKLYKKAIKDISVIKIRLSGYTYIIKKIDTNKKGKNIVFYNNSAYLIERQ